MCRCPRCGKQWAPSAYDLMSGNRTYLCSSCDHATRLIPGWASVIIAVVLLMLLIVFVGRPSQETKDLIEYVQRTGQDPPPTTNP